MRFTNSNLVNVTRLTNKMNNGRNGILYITPHVIVGQWSANKIVDYFATTNRKCSCNYGIGFDGALGLCVEERNTSWCSSSSWNDSRAITIEIASETYKPYVITDAAFNKLVDLVIDICKRYDKTKLLWLKTKEATLGHVVKDNELLITCHRWFASKDCPGDYLISKYNELCERVNKVINREDEIDMTKAEFIESLTPDEAAAIINKARQYYRGLSPSEYAKDALEWSKNNGIMVGDGTGNQMGRDFITREQTITMLKRYDELRD